MKTLTIILVLFCLSSKMHAQIFSSMYDWVNPKPHGNDILDVHYRNLAGFEATFLVAKNGIALTTSNNWGTYQKLTSPTENDLAGITTINSNIICAISNYFLFPQFFSDIYTSTDNGQSWNTALTGVTRLTTIEANDNKIFAAGNQGKIYISTDFGSTFSQSSYQPGVDFHSSVCLYNHHYLAIGSDGNIHKTTNDGLTFSVIPIPGNPVLNRIEGLSDNSVDIAVCGNNGVVKKSTNGGINWITIDPPTVQNLYAIGHNNAQEFYVVGDFGTVYKTTNGGSFWQQINIGTSVNLRSITNLGNEITIYGQDGTMIQSTDNGQTWNNLQKKFTDLTIKSASELISILNQSPLLSEKILVCGYNGLIAKTTDGGDNWINLSSGTNLHLRASFFVDENTGWVAGGSNSQNIILKTTNSGSNWIVQNAPVNDNLNDIHFINSITGVIAGNGGKLLRTTNGGTNWYTVSANTSSNINSVDFKDANTGVIVCTSGFMRRTTNGGANWSNIPLVTASNLYSVSFADANLCYIVGQTGIKLRSTNAGASFTQVSNSQFNEMYSIEWLNSNTGYACGFSNDINNTGSMVKTTDGGLTWNKFFSGTKDSLFTFLVTNNGNAFYAGQEGIVFKLNGRSSVNLKVLIEAYSPNTDTVKLNLRNAVSPFAVVETSKGVIDVNGNVTLQFANVSDATQYYLEVSHRNSIETWSAATQAFSGGILSYDFTTGLNKAYGNNMVLVNGKGCIFSGDVNQDNFVELSDVIAVFNDAQNFATGYVPSDLTGDNFVDVSDLVYCVNNSNMFVGTVRP